MRAIPAFRVLPLVLAASCFALPCAAAEPPPETVAEKKADRPPVLRDLAFRKIAKARELAEQKNFEDALKLLERLREDRRSNGYEQAIAWSISAFCLHELKRTDEAQAAYREVLARNEVPESLRIGTLYSLAQTYMLADDWKNATQTLEQWFTLQAEPSAGAYTLLGQAYYQLKDYASARVPMEKAIDIGRARGEPVRENNYLLLRAIYFGDKDYARLSEVLKNLVVDYPRKDYWLQLAAVYAELDQPVKQLATMQHAYEQGFLTTAAEYTTLAQLLLANEVPLNAAAVVQAGIDARILEPEARTYRLMADAYVMAKEYPKAVAALEKAVEKTQDPEMYLRLAQLYMENAQYQQAAASARTALAKGELSRPDIAHIVNGLSLYELRQLPEARAAFESAAGDERSRAMAQQWQQFIDREQARLSAMQALTAG
ncbi:MAG: tetratricopeptide repeat protein [Panacagrimonas sp.]